MKLKNKALNFAASAILVITLVVSGYLYGTNIDNALSDATVTTLTEITNQQDTFLEQELQTHVDMLTNITAGVQLYGFGSQTKIDESGLAEYLVFCEDYSSFDNVYVASLDGYAYNSLGQLVDITDLNFDFDPLDGKDHLGDLQKGSSTDENFIVMSMAIYSDTQEFLGAVIGQFKASVFYEELVTTYGGEGFALLMDGKGNVIATTDNSTTIRTGDSIYDDLNNFGFVEAISTQQLQALFAAGKSGGRQHAIDGQTREMAFVPLGETSWYVVCSVPTDIISKQSRSVLINTLLLFLEFTVITVIIFIRFRFIKKVHLDETEKIAYYDDLTGLPNLRKLRLEMSNTLKRTTDKDFIIVKFDIINFNIINKLFSFDIGDQILKLIGEFGESNFSKNTVLARTGTDEFMIFTTSDSTFLSKKNREIYEQMFKERIPITFTYDVKFRYSRYKIPHGMIDINEIIDNITLTHNYAKELSSKDIVDYDEKLKAQIIHNSHICSIMHDALANEEFIVYLQPKNDLADLSICGAEALVRWRRPDGTFIFPNDFIPIFEEDGFIVELDKYMLTHTCQIIKSFIDLGRPAIPVSINFSRLNMLNDNFVEEITEIVDSFDIPRKLIEIEITETAILEDEQGFEALFTELHTRGFTLSMDDFGAGYSSFQTLQNLEFDVLKLDRSLLVSENIERRNFILETIIEMAKKLNIKTVCEGVETIDQVEYLRSIDCDIAQGYYFAKPMPNEEFGEMLDK